MRYLTENFEAAVSSALLFLVFFFQFGCFQILTSNRIWINRKSLIVGLNIFRVFFTHFLCFSDNVDPSLHNGETSNSITHYCHLCIKGLNVSGMP